MIGYVAVDGNTDDPTSPTTDPVTWAHPSRALTEAQRLAFEANEDPSHTGSLATIALVDAGTWAPACMECFMGVGGIHDCTARDGQPVYVFDCVLRPHDQVRRGQA